MSEPDVLYVRDVSEPDWVDFVFGFVVRENVDANPVVVFKGCYVVEGGGEIYIFPAILVFDLVQHRGSVAVFCFFLIGDTACSI